MKILVVGDVMLDEFARYAASRISPEAPIPVGLFQSSSHYLGGAGNVANNLSCLGSEVILTSLVGNDHAAETLRVLCKENGVVFNFKNALKNTTHKKRLLVNGQQVLRIDREDTHPKSDVDIKSLELENFDVLIISDYSKGAISVKVIDSLKTRFKGPILCDPKGKDWEKYRGLNVLTPNEKELKEVIGNWTTEKELITKTQSLLELLEVKYILLTRSERGVLLIGETGVYKSTLKVKRVVDVSGAGDSVIAAFAYYLVDYGYENAAYLSNVAGSIAVTKYATSAISSIEIRDYISMDPSLSDLHSIMVKNELSNFKVVFTNGCFDFLHQGHIHVLKEAKKLGDKLVVGLNSDKSVTALKGPTRPLQNEQMRKNALLSTGLVDEVIIFDTETPIDLIKKIKPDILVKGGDYIPSKVVGANFILENGGEIIIVPLLEGYSTSNIEHNIKKI